MPPPAALEELPLTTPQIREKLLPGPAYIAPPSEASLV
jgi:hypothetical protein